MEWHGTEWICDLNALPCFAFCLLPSAFCLLHSGISDKTVRSLTTALQTCPLTGSKAKEGEGVKREGTTEDIAATTFQAANCSQSTINSRLNVASKSTNRRRRREKTGKRGATEGNWQQAHFSRLFSIWLKFPSRRYDLQFLVSFQFSWGSRLPQVASV